MKLLIITANIDFEREIKKVLKKSKIKSYTFQYVKGAHIETQETAEDNWFGGSDIETESVIFNVFVSKTHVDSVFDLIENINTKQEVYSKIHVVSIAIEKNN